MKNEMVNAEDLIEYQEYLRSSPREKRLYIQKKYAILGRDLFLYMNLLEKQLDECNKILKELKI